MPDLGYVFDTIGGPKSSANASQAIGESGGVLCTVRPGKQHTENVTKRTRVTDVLVWTAFLEDHSYGEHFWPVSTRLRKMARDLELANPTIRQVKTTMNWLLSCSKICPPGLRQVLLSQVCLSCWKDSSRCLRVSRSTGMERYRATRSCTAFRAGHSGRLERGSGHHYSLVLLVSVLAKRCAPPCSWHSTSLPSIQ